MKLSPKQLAKYQEIYFATFNEHIEVEEVLAQGLALVHLVRTLTQSKNKGQE